MKKLNIVMLLFVTLLMSMPVNLQAQSTITFADQADCEAGDEFTAYRAGTGMINFKCDKLNTRSETLTAATGSSFSAGDVGYVKSDGTIALASALNATTSQGLLLMAMETVAGDASGKFRYLVGEHTTTGLTAGATYYLSTTLGQLTTTVPTSDGTIKLPIAKALSSTKLFFGYNNQAVVVNTVDEGGGGGITTPAVTTPTVETTSTGFESDGTITTAAPADIEAGNFLIMFAATDESGSANTTYTPPSGFSNLITQQRANAGAAGTDLGGWYKVAGVGEPSSYDLIESGLKNTATTMLRVSGIDPNLPVDVVSCSTGTTEPVTAPSIDVTVDDALVFAVFAWDAAKTLTLAPAGFTAAIHNDQSGVDLWVGYKTQAVSGASGTSVVDISSNTPWVACTISLKEPNATSTGSGSGGGGGGSSDTEGAGSFSLLDDGTGNPIKLTLPIACDGTFVGSACEIFPNNDPHWSAGKPDLATYEHPTYFIRNPNYYTFCSPNTGATTSTANNGRSELRYLANVASGVMSRQFVWRIPNETAVNGLKANIGQIHRGGIEQSPNFKGTYSHVVVRANTAQDCPTAATIQLDTGASAVDDAYNLMGITFTGGTGENGSSGENQVRHITDYVGATKVATLNRSLEVDCDNTTTYEIGDGYYRALSKLTNGASDASFNIGIGDKRLLSHLVSNSFIRTKYYYDMDANTFDFWVSDDEDIYTETELTGTSTHQFTGMITSAGSYAYSKLGMYMNDAGEGSNSTPYCVQTWQDIYTGGL